MREVIMKLEIKKLDCHRWAIRSNRSSAQLVRSKIGGDQY
jgi:hypothetical protein